MDPFDFVMQDPYVAAHAAAADLERRLDQPRHDVAIIMGSGWKVARPLLGDVVDEFPATEVSGFIPSAVEGHDGLIVSMRCGGKRVLAFQGRTHMYQRYRNHRMEADVAVHAVRTAAAFGCKQIILTSAVGGLLPSQEKGAAYMVTDHFSLLVPSPLTGPRFQQCHEPYSYRLQEVARRNGLCLPTGTLAQIIGPHFETNLEARWLQSTGCNLVGMSVVNEDLVALDVGMEVLACSVVTDLAAVPTTHADVLAVVRETAARLAPKLHDVIAAM